MDVEQASWIESGVTSIIVASCSADKRPSLGLGLGCRVGEGRHKLRVFLLEARSHDLLCDLRAGRGVSVLFTQARTTRALQLKAASCREVAIASDDLPFLDRYTERLSAEWLALGQSEGFTRSLLDRRGDSLCAFEVEPEASFDQTPGPQAGAALRGPT